jgi:S1-C subfamily serine protease
MATRATPLSFVDAAPPPPPAAGGGYGAYLGTIPDMSESPGGVRLTGVRAGSPAEAAGIKSGDIIIRLGDHEVTNLYQMTDALRAYKPGDSIVVVVMRDGERLELRATLSRRGG